MVRFFLSLLGGVLLGLVVGLYFSYVQFPVRYINSPAQGLAEHYKDDYTVMIAAGYLADHDALGAMERLRVLGEDNVPEYVQSVTERYISNSRDVQDIRYLVALSEGLGRLTPIMQPYRQVNATP
jgi:hypothetical protein